MSEYAGTNGSSFPADLLSSLAANPDLLKNAMQMASVLASSGALGGLFGAPTGEPSPPPSPPFTPSGQGAPNANSGISDLLAGLMGSTGAPPDHKSTNAPEQKKVEAEQRQERKRPPAPSHNDRIHLLQSICPFLPEEKREKVQFLIKLLGLLSAAEQMGLGKLF
ncbi:MAG: hypothetical protein J6R82_04785 [Clostridia bacterium]|nr:hypothetical protein [Clostridia bacterium]